MMGLNRRGVAPLLIAVILIGILIGVAIVRYIPCIPLPSAFYKDKEFCLFDRGVLDALSFWFYALIWFSVQAGVFYIYFRVIKWAVVSRFSIKSGALRLTQKMKDWFRRQL